MRIWSSEIKEPFTSGFSSLNLTKAASEVTRVAVWHTSVLLSSSIGPSRQTFSMSYWTISEAMSYRSFASEYSSVFFPIPTNWDPWPGNSSKDVVVGSTWNKYSKGINHEMRKRPSNDQDTNRWTESLPWLDSLAVFLLCFLFIFIRGEADEISNFITTRRLCR